MSPAAVVVRDATHTDLQALLALEALFPGDRMSARQYRRHLANPGARMRVAMAAGALVGASVLFFRRGSTAARLYSLIVAPAARGQGLGRRLLDDAEQGAGARGCSRLRLEVRADNAAAIALYRQRGYQSVGRIDGYYEDGADALRFHKPLMPDPVR